MQNHHKTRLLWLCERHQIPENEKEFWISRLELASETICKHVLGLFEDSPGKIRWLYTIQRKKEIALAEGTQSAWENILDEEHNHILAALTSSNQNK
jgi:hypothetical protein